MALGAKLYVTFQRRFLAFWNPIDPYNWNPFGLINFSGFLEFVDTLKCMLVLKLPCFFPHRIGGWKSAAISKQSYLLTPSSRSYVVLALKAHFLCTVSKTRVQCTIFGALKIYTIWSIFSICVNQHATSKYWKKSSGWRSWEWHRWKIFCHSWEKCAASASSLVLVTNKMKHDLSRFQTCNCVSTWIL